jgi:hypothetical protein
MGGADTEAIARNVFAEIARRFPSLQMVETHDDPVEISITMPVQPGLSHKVWLCLQNGDELGFSSATFTSSSSHAQNQIVLRNIWTQLSGSCPAGTGFSSTTGEQNAIGPNYKDLKATAGALLPIGLRSGFSSG